MPTRRHPRVAHLEEVAPTESARGTRFAFVRRQLGTATGGKAIGCSHMELAPGKTGWPFHWHCANEEALYVLEGRGRLRLGTEEIPVRAGDYVALPAGPEAPHQLRNDGPEPLRYLALSTMAPVDVTTYPDSGKVWLSAGAAPGGKKEDRYLSGIHRVGPALDYFDGEDVGEPGST